MNLENLNGGTPQQRLAAVSALGESVKEGVRQNEEVNNHVHSIYSFSPYSPTMIAVKAAQAGLRTVGIMDHDSVPGCEGFLEACKAVNIASRVGAILDYADRGDVGDSANGDKKAEKFEGDSLDERSAGYI